MKLAVAATLAVAAALVPAQSSSSSASRYVLTERGTGRLLLGSSLGSIRARGLIGSLSPGCELAQPRPYVAPLRAPLVGTATFDGRKATSRLIVLSVRGGPVATSRGIAIGSRGLDALHAYPNAHIKNSAPSNPIVFHAVVIKRDGRYRLWFLLDGRGHVTSFEVPLPQICE